MKEVIATENYGGIIRLDMDILSGLVQNPTSMEKKMRQLKYNPMHIISTTKYI
jgi:hypothetical protein